MSNLLPQEEKEILNREYCLRLFALSGFFISILLLISAIVFSAYILLIRSEFDPIEKDIVLSEEDTEEAELKKIAEKTEEELSILSLSTDTFSFNDVVELLFRHKNETISISQISFQNNPKEDVISIEGTAKTRDGLVLFLESLEGDEKVSVLESPISNLSKNTDISFSAHIKLK
jgi:hypothetical protein